MAVTLPTSLQRTARLHGLAVEADRAPVPGRAPWTRLPGWFGPVALVALMLALRRTDLWLNPQFFQEDGGVFFEQNYLHGWRALLTPYAGYLDVISRLAAWAAGFLPLVAQPALYNAAAAGLCLAVVARIFRPGIRLPHKTLLAAAVLLIPRDYYGEILGNLTNVQWFLALVPVLMLVEDTAPTGWRAAWDLVQLALVGLNGPFVLLSVPLFAVKWFWMARSRWNALCLGVAVVCGGVQAWFIHHEPDLPVISPTLSQWLTFLVWKPIGPLFFGDDISVAFLAPAGALAVLAGLGILLAVLNRRQPVWLWPTAVFTVYGGCVLLGSVSRFVRSPEVFLPVDNSDRYFFLPRLLLIWGLLVHLRAHTGWRRGVLWTLLTLAAVAAAADFACHPLPDTGWREQVAAFERGKTDTLKTFPGWRIFMDRPAARGDRHADVLGATPLRIIPPEDVARVRVGPDSFLQLRSAASAVIYELPAQSRTVAGRYAAAPDAEGEVEFSVLYIPANDHGAKVLWRRRLDPARVPADRGAHDFEAVIPPQSIGRIILGFRPVSGEKNAGGGCLAGIRFR